ncbi:hypothetical protein EJ110_NYTH27678 [Nymphaea thermarum]|nr:hypothetical protein EJ110_NYTH27678 [Nymphaea thermarum]
MSHVFRVHFNHKYYHRKRTKVIQGPKAESSETKKAKLLARRNERISLSSYSDQFGVSYPIADFLNHPMGIESMLNTRALQRFEQLTPSTYRESTLFSLLRCYLQKIQLLNFEVAPILDLSVTPTSDACIVEMLSCKFEGSEILEEQNKHFSAFMRNHIRWNENCPEPFLDVDVEVTILLEVYTMPFVMLPISAVETPGNFNNVIYFFLFLHCTGSCKLWLTDWFHYSSNNSFKIIRLGQKLNLDFLKRLLPSLNTRMVVNRLLEPSAEHDVDVDGEGEGIGDHVSRRFTLCIQLAVKASDGPHTVRTDNAAETHQYP